MLRAALGVEEGEEEEEGGGEARTDAAEPAPAPSPYLWISAMAVGVSQRLPGLTDQERPYLPISLHISPYLPISPHISLPGLTDQERIAMDDLLTTAAARFLFSDISFFCDDGEFFRF